MEALLQIDQAIFEWINGTCQNAFFDMLVPYWRNKLFWIPMYAFLFFFLWYNFRWKGMFVVLGVLLTITFSDLTSSQLIKKSVKRLRPCKQVEIPVHQLIHCGSGYSFPSSHATNHFAIAVFLMGTLGRRFRKINLPLLLWAATIALGQVYVGVHFPSDILAGAILGSLIGGVVGWRFRKHVGPL